MATDPAAITSPAAGTGVFAGAGTLMDAGPATNTGMGATTNTVPGPTNGSVPGTPTTPTSAAAGGVLSGRVTKGKTKTTTPKKATPKKKAAAAAAAATNPGNNNDSPSGSNAGTDSPNPPKRGKASSGLPSCLPCRRAKSRCDRVVACVRCVKADKECVSHAEEGASSAGGGGGKAGGGSKACERCRKMKAACVRTDTCVRCEKRGVECVMA
jgi:hypothetical protein